MQQDYMHTEKSMDNTRILLVWYTERIRGFSNVGTVLVHTIIACALMVSKPLDVHCTSKPEPPT